MCFVLKRTRRQKKEKNQVRPNMEMATGVISSPCDRVRTDETNNNESSWTLYNNNLLIFLKKYHSNKRIAALIILIDRRRFGAPL